MTLFTRSLGFDGSLDRIAATPGFAAHIAPDGALVGYLVHPDTLRRLASLAGAELVNVDAVGRVDVWEATAVGVEVSFGDVEDQPKESAWSRGYQCAHDDMTAEADTDA